MNIDRPLIRHLEKLVRLELSEEERESLRTDLNAILAMVEKLQEVDTEGVEPLTHLSDTLHALRADEVRGQVTREQALGNAPDSDGVFFRVPKVIDK
jgi:aspartyl-tRNA(Asn)/glutamyl-tRNA(Gln) amidotransferase subunit C